MVSRPRSISKDPRTGKLPSGALPGPKRVKLPPLCTPPIKAQIAVFASCLPGAVLCACCLREMASLVLRVDVRVYTCSKTRNGRV